MKVIEEMETGTKLFDAMFTFLKENGAKYIQVDVTKGNESVIHLYERFGLHVAKYVMITEKLK